MSCPYSDDLKARIASRLAAFDLTHGADVKNLKRAAVSIVVVALEGERTTRDTTEAAFLLTAEQQSSVPMRSGYLIAPIVLRAPRGTVANCNGSEVERIFHIPFAELRRRNAPEIFAIQESDRPVIRLYLPSLSGHINAPTAALLYQFREVALEGRATRVDHFDQPVWAWR